MIYRKYLQLAFDLFTLTRWWNNINILIKKRIIHKFRNLEQSPRLIFNNNNKNMLKFVVKIWFSTIFFFRLLSTFYTLSGDSACGEKPANTFWKQNNRHSPCEVPSEKAAVANPLFRNSASTFLHLWGSSPALATPHKTIVNTIPCIHRIRFKNSVLLITAIASWLTRYVTYLFSDSISNSLLYSLFIKARQPSDQ